ncbi:MAG: diacylglycerol kinase family protein [Deltaproteobacteria bacterium]|nr:diacylglycerol kinase family protein [Deltaproteobacteria bacterium]
MKWGLIYNPAAGSYRPSVVESLLSALQAQGIETRLLPTKSPGHATELARQAQGLDRLAVYGGDGTINEAANGLLGRRLPLVVVPGGTANVLRLALKLPRNPVQAALLQAGKEQRAVYPGLVDKRAFLLMVGFGFDAEAVFKVNPGLKALTGKGAYVWSALKALANRREPLQASLDGGPPLEGDWLVAARCAYYGGNFRIHPRAGLEQQALGITLVERRGLLSFLGLQLGLGQHREAPGVALREAREVLVRGPGTLHAQIDGDYLGSGSSFRVSISGQPIWLSRTAGD